MIGRHSYLASILERHPDHLPSADFGDESRAVGGDAPMVMLRVKVSGYQNLLSRLLRLVQVLGGAQTVGGAYPGLWREAGSVVYEHKF